MEAWEWNRQIRSPQQPTAVPLRNPSTRNGQSLWLSWSLRGSSASGIEEHSEHSDLAGARFGQCGLCGARPQYELAVGDGVRGVCALVLARVRGVASSDHVDMTNQHARVALTGSPSRVLPPDTDTFPWAKNGRSNTFPRARYANDAPHLLLQVTLSPFVLTVDINTLNDPKHCSRTRTLLSTPGRFTPVVFPWPHSKPYSRTARC